MAREPARSSALFGAGRAALAALAEALEPEAGGALARLLTDEPVLVRDALASVVARSAFVLSALGRGLGSGGPVEQSERWFPSRASALKLGALSGVALRALERTPGLALDGLSEEELGSVYEGTLGTTLELATEALVLVVLPKRAGNAPTELALPLPPLLEVSGELRVRRCLALGLSLPEKARRSVASARDVEALGRALSESRGSQVRLVPRGRATLRLTAERRRSGSHYTPRPLAERVVALALSPLLPEGASAERILDLRVCDPAMGTGAFLIATCRLLAERLLRAETPERTAWSAAEIRDARRRVAERCLFGVDRDGVAVDLARLSLWLTVGDPELGLDFLDGALAAGESLLGPPPSSSRVSAEILDWARQFFPVVVERGGFDAFVGNPPWVSYVGRAAQPLADELRSQYERYDSFGGYKNLQGLFVERSARLLRPGGRLGLLLPSSMSELSGYAPTRGAHDRLCEPDPVLTDVGNAGFEGVFQPCMVLASTRRAVPLLAAPEVGWPIERPDLDALDRQLMAKLERAPLPARLFGERGLQSMGEDWRHLAATPDERHSVPLRTGSDVEAFRLRAPSLFADPAWFGRRLRPAAEWARVCFVVRQTARVPLAALSDGVAFRNSLLAGFEDDDYPAPFLVAYLNSTPIRWLHYVRHRDARQGMPQLKVMHLRRTPAPPRSLVDQLTRIGNDLSGAKHGVDRSVQARLDRLVADAFGLSARERERLERARLTIGGPV